MSKLFNLKILTPEHKFFDGDVEAVTVESPDGQVTILPGHADIIMPVSVGMIKIKKGGEWSEAVNSEGFMETTGLGTTIFVQACEHPEEIDLNRAKEALRRAEEQLRQKQSKSEYTQSKLSLARAMARLRAANTNRRFDI